MEGKESHRRSVPDRVAGLYYAHGLFCSSHPIAVIGFAIATVLLSCYPLLNLPLPGNVPQRLWSPGNSSQQGLWNNTSAPDGLPPRWFTGPPALYVQQVVLRTSVVPWSKDLLLTDAFRAPLAQVFQLLEIIRNYQHHNSSKTLSNLCLHVEAVKIKSSEHHQSVLPEYNCLLLSPANLWQHNMETFQEDSNLLTTIFGYQNLQKGKVSLAEMLFGMNMKETGIKRYPLRTRQRVLQFAITIIMHRHDREFLLGLRQKLCSAFPLHQLTQNDSFNVDSSILHIYYPGYFHYRELLPLAITYCSLFLYVYFSVRKIELVKSKFGMAFSAMVTVLASLSMSIGLCFFFGLTLSLNGKEIFPYLLVIVGLENVLVLTKSVVSTPMHLDVKIRVAQGLSREGWSITKNLLTEVTILTIGLFTFVPAIQEFCIFAVVGLLSDFFLQMVFFSTVLAIDIRRMEQSSEYVRINIVTGSDNKANARRFRQPYSQNAETRSIVRSKSHPRLNGLVAAGPTNVIASYNNGPSLVKLPKRLQLVHFWARTRIFQRMFMVSMVVWISVIAYSSFPVEQLFPAASDSTLHNINIEKSPIGQTLTDLESLGSQLEVPKNFLEKDLRKLSTVQRAALLDNVADLKKLTPTQRAAVLDNIANLKRFTPAQQTEILENIADLKKLNSHETELKLMATSASVMLTKAENALEETGSDDLSRLKHVGLDPWFRLSDHHWPAILSLYNISLSGRYISLLPSVRLSTAVDAETARAMRNTNEKEAQHFRWQALAAALDPLDFTEGSESSSSGSQTSSSQSDAPFVPTSPMELFLTSVLCVISVVVVAYMMVVLYGCVCTRNYAEWRSSWKDNHSTHEQHSQVVMEAVPLVLEGHPQDIECLTTDGVLVVTSDLSGQLRVWDSMSGEPLACVDRQSYFSSVHKRMVDGDEEDLPLSDYESGSPPSSGEAALDTPVSKKSSSHRTRAFASLSNSPTYSNYAALVNPNLRRLSTSAIHANPCVLDNGEHLVHQRICSKHPNNVQTRGNNASCKYQTSNLTLIHSAICQKSIDDKQNHLFDDDMFTLSETQGYKKVEVPRNKSSKYSDTFWNMPDLRLSINTNFMSLKSQHGGVPHINGNVDSSELAQGSKDACQARTEQSGFDYGDKYRQIYEEHNRSLSLESDEEEENAWKTTNSSSCYDTGQHCGIDSTCSCVGALDIENQCSSVFNKSGFNLFSQSNLSNNCSLVDRYHSGRMYDHNSTDSNSLLGCSLYSPEHFNDKVNLRHSSCENDSYLSIDSRGVMEPNTEERSRVSLNSVEPSSPGTCRTHVTGVRNEHLNLGTSPTDSRAVLGLLSLGDRSRVFTGGSQVPQIWCIDCQENLVAIGCANGRLEFWEGSTGTFKCLFEDGSGVGTTQVKVIGNLVVAAKLSGCLDFLELESYSQGRPTDWGFTSNRRTHMRTGSAGSAFDWDAMVSRSGSSEDIRCIRLKITRPHQQPITVLDSEGGRVLTGSQDHTLKVFRLEDQLPLYTLHGHCGPITCMFIDRISPMTSGSGSQDGLLCVWDLLTGTCMYSIQAHDGSVTALTYSASYVISLGSDERLCVWERFQGHLLNTIQVQHTYCMVMLTHNLLVTSKQGSLIVWDVRTGDPVRMVTLGHNDSCVYVKQIVLLSDSIACDYANQLRIVRFPLVTDKCD